MNSKKSLFLSNINILVKSGNQHKIENVYFKNFRKLKKNNISLSIFQIFLIIGENVKPLVGLTSKKVGSATYKIPVNIGENKATLLGMHWMLNKSCGRKLGAMDKCLLQELSKAYNGAGHGVKKKDSIHVLAKQNRVYLRYII